MTNPPTRYAFRSKTNKQRSRATIVVPPEQRLIVVAQGVEFHNTNLAQHNHLDWQVPHCLSSINGVSINSGMTTAFYHNHNQNVVYQIRVTTSKSEFHSFLEGTHPISVPYRGNVLVIYSGHARYGRGPCFGATGAPGNHWGTGDNPRTEGIFRMGYPYLMVPVSEVLHHGYEAMIARQTTSDPTITAVNLKQLNNRGNQLHPKLRYRARRSYTRAVSISDLDTIINRYHSEVKHAATRDSTLRRFSLPNGGFDLRYVDPQGFSDLFNITHGITSIRPFIYGRVDGSDRFWVTREQNKLRGPVFVRGSWQNIEVSNPRSSDGTFNKPFVVLHADWRNTISGLWHQNPSSAPARMDLGATHLACRGFCHFGCSTKMHNYRVMRVFKNWRLSTSGNNKLCYWTTGLASADIGQYWLRFMLTYSPGARFGGRTFGSNSWGDVCEYAKEKTNAALRADGYNYKIY